MIGPRKVDKPLVLYGYGRLGHLAEEIFNKLKIPIDCIIDAAFPTSCLLGECHFGTEKDESLLAICVTTEPYGKIIAPLQAAGWQDIVSVYDILEAYPECGVTGGWSFTWRELSFGEEDECDTVSSRFSDNVSRVHYRAFFGWRNAGVRYEDPSLEITDDRWMIPEVKAVLCGTEPRSTYCEISGSTLADIEKRRYEGRIDFAQIAFGSPLSFVQLHLEGRELEAIERNMPYFQKHRPIIAVTVYHSRDGLWKIEKALMDGLTNYRFLFRLHAYQGQAAIMYCLPNERSATNGTRKIGS